MHKAGGATRSISISERLPMWTPCSPSPQPSPAGRGSHHSQWWNSPGDTNSQMQRAVLPLPEGEGWGEGEETTECPETRHLCFALILNAYPYTCRSDIAVLSAWQSRKDFARAFS